MKTTTISKGGQVSIPAAVRHRWGTRNVVIEDQGSAILVRPIPADPIGAALGSLAGRGPNSDELRAILREEESATDAHRRVGS
jgi:bifunctional DNA-binding transcriptional regulator/antitoxin component of YhaV-PrlF toxin-antitoxin module